MDSSRLNQYRIMWVFVFFDLPTDTKRDRKNYAIFRKSLQKEGFSMLQFSIYARHCSSRENADVHIKRVKSFLAPRGEVILFMLTDKQFGQMEFFRSRDPVDRPGTPQQLEMFWMQKRKKLPVRRPEAITIQLFYFPGTDIIWHITRHLKRGTLYQIYQRSKLKAIHNYLSLLCISFCAVSNISKIKTESNSQPGLSRQYNKPRCIKYIKDQNWKQFTTVKHQF